MFRRDRHSPPLRACEFLVDRPHHANPGGVGAASFPLALDVVAQVAPAFCRGSREAQGFKGPKKMS